MQPTVNATPLRHITDLQANDGGHVGRRIVMVAHAHNLAAAERAELDDVGA